MKFFKHFCDAHRGKSIQGLRDELGNERGWRAIGMYWTLVEICAEKLEKRPEEEFSEQHCRFEFKRRYIRSVFDLYHATYLEDYLQSMANLQLISFESTKDLIIIYMPKLLESLDRDTKRARQVRGPSAPKIKIEDKDKEYKGSSEISVSDIETIYLSYPLKKGKTKGVASLMRQIKTKGDLELLRRAVNAYAAECVGKESKYIQHFSTFANSTWKDCLDPDYGSAASKANNNPDTNWG